MTLKNLFFCLAIGLSTGCSQGYAQEEIRKLENQLIGKSTVPPCEGPDDVWYHDIQADIVPMTDVLAAMNQTNVPNGATWHAKMNIAARNYCRLTYGDDVHDLYVKLHQVVGPQGWQNFETRGDHLAVKCSQCNEEFPVYAPGPFDRPDIAKQGRALQKVAEDKWKGIMRLSCGSPDFRKCLDLATTTCDISLPVLCAFDQPGTVPISTQWVGNPHPPGTSSFEYEGVVSTTAPINPNDPNYDTRTEIDQLCVDSHGPGWKALSTADTNGIQVIDTFGNVGANVSRAWIHNSGQADHLNCWDQ